MPGTKPLQELTGLAYEAALEPARWSDFLSQTARAVNSRSAFLRLVNYEAGHVGFFESAGYDQSYVDAYRNHFVRLDPYAAKWTAAPAGKVLTAELVSGLPERKHTEYYNDYERPQGILDGAGCVLARNSQYNLQFSTQREMGTSLFHEDKASMQLLQSLMPHLARAVQIQRHLAEVDAQKSQALDTFQHLRLGVILADVSGRFVFVNRAAEDLLAQCQGIGFSQNGLVFRRPDDNARLRGLIAAATRLIQGEIASADSLMRVVLDDGETLQIQVAPLRHAQTRWEILLGQGAIALFLSKSGRLRLNWKKLVHLHGITRSEARLACLLAEGRTIEEAAAELNVSKTTARSQLQSIFLKTDTRRQSELVGLLLTSVLANLRSEP